jgi:GT2 family glycosyltransferase
LKIDYSIIIPYQSISNYLKETLNELKKQKSESFEVVLIPDKKHNIEDLGVEGILFPIQILESGEVSPSIKRDLGAKVAKGDYLAFIDDDAYPDPEWLNTTSKKLKDKNILGVGGPQVTPPQDSFWQKVSGAMFVSFLNGSAWKRYYPDFESEGMEIDDWPTVNFVVRKEIFWEVGGFDSNFYPGEDTKLCLDILNTNKGILVYEPNALVFHHRRSGFIRHMRQVGRYGLHRGHFARSYPKTSLKLMYLIPTFFVMYLFLLLGAVFLISKEWNQFLFIPMVIYFGILALSTIDIIKKIKYPRVALCTIPYFIGTHIIYGIRFIEGFFKKQNISKLGR